MEESLNLSSLKNISIQIAKINYEIAEKDLNIEKARLSPSASIKVSKTENKDFSSSIDSRDDETVQAKITWPIIKGGKIKEKKKYVGKGQKKQRDAGEESQE